MTLDKEVTISLTGVAMRVLDGERHNRGSWEKVDTLPYARLVARPGIASALEKAASDHQIPGSRPFVGRYDLTLELEDAKAIGRYFLSLRGSLHFFEHAVYDALDDIENSIRRADPEVRKAEDEAKWAKMREAADARWEGRQ